MKLIILCQERLFREGLATLLESEKVAAPVEVIGLAGNGRRGLELAKDRRPDVAVVSLHLEELNGIDATRRLLDEVPGVNVLILASHSKAESLTEALEAGALGFITRDTGLKELALALNAVAKGKPHLDSESTEVLIQQKVKGVEDPVFGLLTEREREVLQLLAEGFGSKEIGEKLHISSKTVDTHRQNIMEKLETDNLPDLVKHAIRAGLTSVKTD